MADSSKRRPPLGVKGTQRAPDVTATRPHARHRLSGIGGTSHRKEKNSLIEGWVDVQADMDAINAGDGVFDPATRQVWVNGRLYGMHENGTTFPIEGDGIIPVARPVYKALTIIRRYNGVDDRSEHEIRRDPAISEADRAEAIRLWRLREGAGRHATDDDV